MKYLILALCLLSIIQAHGQEANNEPLAVLKPFIGTWKAEVGKDAFDVSHYAWILGGKALRIMHSINDGDYGGEALLHWDAEKQVITYRYVTTASFYTEGTITPTIDGFEAHETVHGNMNGITETRAGYAMNNGEIQVWSQFFKDGQWTEKAFSTYVRAPNAEVRFQ